MGRRRDLQILARQLKRRFWTPGAARRKQRIVKDYARRFGLRVLVETGTYLGDMVDATQREFREIHSIELDEALYASAKHRFRTIAHVHLYRGDSGELLPVVLSRISEPCLFWLDAHPSGGVTAGSLLSPPVTREVEAILAHPTRGHVVLIDDAASFTGHDGYPSLDELRRLASSCRLEELDGVIRIVPDAGDAPPDGVERP